MTRQEKREFVERIARRVEALNDVIAARCSKSRRFRALVALLEEDGFKVGVELQVDIEKPPRARRSRPRKP